MASKLVCIFGLKRSGKDTLGDCLVRDYNYTKLHFADNLRSIMYAMNPIINTEDGKLIRLCDLVDDVGWEIAKAEYPEVRRIMQTLGTDGIRNVLGDHTWIDALEKQIDAIPGPVVVTDGRFFNESRWCKSLGGVVVVMHRRWAVEPEIDQHASEQEIGLIQPDIDIMIEAGLEEVRSYSKVVNDLTKHK